MKKVNCIAIYTYNHGYQLNKVVAKHKTENICLYSDNWDYIDKKHAYNYPTINDLYSDVLAMLKTNSFYVASWEQFNTKWYDIDFIDTYDFSVNHYSYKK